MSKIQIRINHKVVNEFESVAEFMQFLARHNYHTENDLGEGMNRTFITMDDNFGRPHLVGLAEIVKED